MTRIPHRQGRYMPERNLPLLCNMRRLLLAVACGIFAGHSALARQDEQTDAMRILLKSLQTALKDDGGTVSAQALIEQAGLTPYVTPRRTLAQSSARNSSSRSRSSSQRNAHYEATMQEVSAAEIDSKSFVRIRRSLAYIH